MIPNPIRRADILSKATTLRLRRCLMIGLSTAAVWAHGVCLAAISSMDQPTGTQSERLADIIYMDQPTGIEPAVYVSTWPILEPYLERLKTPQARSVEADLRSRVAAARASDGELNLLAQLQWQRGDLDGADLSIAKAISLKPDQSLNWSQQAMVNFAHLQKASGMLQRWKWQQRTRDAYQRTFDLDPRNVPARYYLAYTYMNTPAIGGGDLKKALELSEGGIALGQNGFYAVRADAHRLRGELDAANADYDTAIKLKVIKLGGLLDAAEEELKRKNWQRAKRYLDWAVHCRPDAGKAFEGLGDYYVAINDEQQARKAYETAVQKDSRNKSAKAKLARLPAAR